MRFLGNIIWILCGGLLSALGWWIVGLLWCCTVVGIPVGLQEISVDEYISTIEYDYPEFHLSMRCYWCSLISGDLVLKEAEDAKWLDVETIDSVKWLPADITLIDEIKKRMA